MDTQNPVKSPEADVKPITAPSEEKDETVTIRMWPKTPVLYPVAILALLFSIFGHFWGESPHIRALKAQIAQPAAASTSGGAMQTEVQGLISGYNVDRALGLIFLLVLAFSLFTLCVDFEIRWALITFAGSMVILLFIYILDERLQFLPRFFERLFSLTPTASPQFYFFIFLIWVILMLISMSIVRFHYVKIESNEAFVMGGLLQRQQRFSTQRMKFDKDIQDVIEYYLPFVRSGRLILNFPDQHETVVIENVIQIEKVVEKLDKITSVLRVESEK